MALYLHLNQFATEKLPVMFLCAALPYSSVIGFYSNYSHHFPPTILLHRSKLPLSRQMKKVSMYSNVDRYIYAQIPDMSDG